MFFRAKKAHAAYTRDWATEATDVIENVIDGIRDKTVVPLTTIVRGIVYGTLAAIVGVLAIVLAAILFSRILYIYIPNIPGAPDGVWLPNLVAGAIFICLGLFAWSRRTPKR